MCVIGRNQGTGDRRPFFTLFSVRCWSNVRHSAAISDEVTPGGRVLATTLAVKCPFLGDGMLEYAYE